MKIERLLALLGCLCAIVSLSASTDEEFETDSLKNIRGRWEVGLGTGYTYLDNHSVNHKTTTYTTYNKSLENAFTLNAGLAYHINSYLKGSLNYSYTGTKNSELYKVDDDEVGLELYNISDDYRFHQVSFGLHYLIPIQSNLFLVPGIGSGIVFFKNDAQLVSEYTQKSMGWSLNPGLTVDYYISNHVGISSGYHFRYIQFEDDVLKAKDSVADTGLVGDSSFFASDFFFKLIILF